MNKLLFILCITILCWGCTSETEKHQKNRNNIVNMKDKIKEIEIDDVLISSTSRLYLIWNYLIIGDYMSPEKQIHLFDKENFNYITSIADRGQGPDEITVMGHIEPDKTNRVFYVSDHGKLKIFTYDLDSVISNPQYGPKEKMKMNNTLFPDKYQYVNDTLSIGIVIAPIGNSDYSGGKNFSDEQLPTKLLVFDINGDYIKTIENNYKICDFCYDQENNRIILNLDHAMQFSYLELDGII